LDLDYDFDLDLIIGDIDGSLHYYENIGDRNTPEFQEDVTFFLTPTYVDVGQRSSPTVGDLDNDGDYDLLIGDIDGKLHFYRNTGSKSAAVYNKEATFQSNIDVGTGSNPTLVELNGDGKLDLIIGNWEWIESYYINTGSSAEADFTLDPSTYDGLDVGFNSAAAFYDLNNDGLQDLVIGHKQYSLEHPLLTYINNGTQTMPVWEEHTSYFPEVAGILERHVAPVFADMDNDGDKDLIAGSWDGRLYYFESTGTPDNPEWTYRPTFFLAIDVGNHSIPAVGDIDGDGDLDLTVGEEIGELAYFPNIGTVSEPVFDIAESDTTTYDNIDVGNNSAPTLMDFDADGDLDLFVGEYRGLIHFYENTGSVTEPIWTHRPNFMDEINFDVDWFPVLNNSDVDGDQINELIVGEQSGTVKVYWNYQLLQSGEGNIGPQFSNPSPSRIFDDEQFYIRCAITDADGVFDDDTGSQGSGIYLLWDNDGDVTNSFNEIQMNRITGTDTFRTISRIPSQQFDANFVYQIFAYDLHPNNAMQSSSPLYSVTMMDDDTKAPQFVFFEPDSTPANQPFHVRCGVEDVSSIFDDTSASEGQGPFLRWDSDGEVQSTFNEIAMNRVAENLLETEQQIPAQADANNLIYQVTVYDNDHDNNYDPDRSKAVSDLQLVRIGTGGVADDDYFGPTIKNITTMPDTVYDTEAFHIVADITDQSGVYDDSTGSAGQGVYVHWDSDGEIENDFQETTMSLSSGSTFQTDTPIPSHFWGVNFVARVAAYDNDFENEDERDRQIAFSQLTDITILDDDPFPPTFVLIEPPHIVAQESIPIKAVITDSSGVYNQTDGESKGVFLSWDIDGELYNSSNEIQMNDIGSDTFLVSENIPGQAAGTRLLFTITALDNDFDNQAPADRAEATSDVTTVIIHDEDDNDFQGPQFDNWEPKSVFDDEAFFIQGDILDPSGIYDDDTGVDGRGAYILWDNDGELANTSNELQLDPVSQSKFQTVAAIPSQPADVSIVYQVFAYDNDMENGTADQSLGISNGLVVQIHDDDTQAPQFSAISPTTVYDSAAFYIQCDILDESGVYDDQSGRDGFGTYLLLDNDGELEESAKEYTLSLDSANTYRTDQAISMPSSARDIIFQIFAFDNDTDNENTQDRQFGASLAQSVNLIDDDTQGPTITDIEIIQAPNDNRFLLECLITDRSGVYDDDTDENGQGAYLKWDTDGELQSSANTLQLDFISDGIFRTTEMIDAEINENFVYQISAFDNDFDNSYPGDRTQTQTEIFNGTETGSFNENLTLETFAVAPNPFSETAHFIIKANKDATVEIEFFTISGEKMCDIEAEYLKNNLAEVNWDGVNNTGHKAASGVYIYRFHIIAGDEKLTRTGKVGIVR